MCNAYIAARRRLIARPSSPTKLASFNANVPLPSAVDSLNSNVHINNAEAHVNATSDPSRLSLDSNTVSNAIHSVNVLTRFVDGMTREEHARYDEFGGKSTEFLESAVKKIVQYVEETIDKIFGDDLEGAIFFKQYGSILTVEELDEKKLKAAGKHIVRRTCPGEIAGLCDEYRPFLKRIHMLVDSVEGAYGCNNTGKLYHYQVKMANLESYLLDAVNQKVSPKIGGLNDCGIVDELGILRVREPRYNEREDPLDVRPEADLILYTSATPFVETKSIDMPYDISLDRVDSSVPEKVHAKVGSQTSNTENGDVIRSGFFAVIGKGAKEIQDFVDALKMESMFEYLTGNNAFITDKTGPDNCGASLRNQRNSVNFGYNGQNCTDHTNPDVAYINAPKITTRYNESRGLNGDETMRETLSKTLLSMTELIDSICRLFDISPIFADEDRVLSWANKIISGNRIEKFTAAICNLVGLGCHVDDMNGLHDNYRWNITAFKYLRNHHITDPTNKEYYTRLHYGGYSRRICECIKARADNMTLLGYDLQEYLRTLPARLKEYSYDAVFGPGSKECHSKCKNGVYDYSTTPHVNKFVYYSYFANVLLDWQLRRKMAGAPLSVYEALEGVHSAVRWTTSASAWANAFRNLTSDCGSEVEVPKGAKVSKSVWEQIKPRKDGSRPKVKTWECSLPLFCQYVLKVLAMYGGVATGDAPRFQSHMGDSVVNVDRESRSTQHLLGHYFELLTCTESAKKKHEYKVIDTDEKFLDWAMSIRSITQKFVIGVANYFNKDGVLGIGELLGHHVIGILGLCGWIDPAHAINTSFSKGNGTSDFLTERYGLTIKHYRYELIRVLRKDFSSQYGIHTDLVVENSTCKYIQNWRTDSCSRFSDPLYKGPGNFLCDIIDGSLTALMKGENKPITSGVVTKQADLDLGNRFDVRLLRKPGYWYKSSRWWETQFTLSKLMPEFQFKSSDKNLKKKLKSEASNLFKKKTKKMKRGPMKNNPSTTATHRQKAPKGKIVITRDILPARGRETENGKLVKWGYVGCRKKRVLAFTRHKIFQLFIEMQRNERMRINGIAKMKSTEILQRVVAEVQQDSSKIDDIKKKAIELIEILRDSTNNVNEIGKSGQFKTETEKYFEEFNNIIFHIAEKRYNSAKPPRKRLNIKVDKNPTWKCHLCDHVHRGKKQDSERFCTICGTDRETPCWKCHECEHLHVGIEKAGYLICENEDCGAIRNDNRNANEIGWEFVKADSDVISQFIVRAQNRRIPSYHSFSNSSRESHVRVNLEAEVAALASVLEADLNLKFTCFRYDSWQYWNCSLTCGGPDSKTYSSSDAVFIVSARGKKDLPFCIGLREIKQCHYYETRAHAKLALLMVIAKKTQQCFTEKRFLSAGKDFIILEVNDNWSYDYNKGQDSSLVASPICSFMRTKDEIIAIDMGQLAFIDFRQLCNVTDMQDLQDNLSTKALKKLATSEVVHDLKKVYYNEVTKKWTPLSEGKQAHFRAKESRYSHNLETGFNGIISYIAPATAHNQIHLSNNTISTLKYEKSLSPGWVRTVVKHSVTQERTSSLFWSPKKHYDFRSLYQARIFDRCIAMANGDEDAAKSDHFQIELKKQNELRDRNKQEAIEARTNKNCESKNSGAGVKRKFPTEAK